MSRERDEHKRLSRRRLAEIWNIFIKYPPQAFETPENCWMYVRKLSPPASPLPLLRHAAKAAVSSFCFRTLVRPAAPRGTAAALGREN